MSRAGKFPSSHKFRKFPEISGNFREFPDFRKYPEIYENLQKYFQIIGIFWSFFSKTTKLLQDQ